MARPKKVAPKKVPAKKTPATKLDISTPSIMVAYVPSPVKEFTSNKGRSRTPSLMWETPEWDLAECGRIVDVESLVRRAFRVKKNLFLKEGYEFTGPNPERSLYIKKRLLQIEHASRIPFPVLLDKTIASLIRCSNAFWIKVRKYSASGGKLRIVNKKELEPVAAYFLAPPETIRIKRDEYGRIVKYRQEVYGKEPVDFAPENVVHFYLDRREGFAVGTPSLVPVKDDIRALRRIEENVELLVHQHLFPLFHYKVGTPEKPAGMLPNGQDEIRAVEVKMAQMPADGFWVTPERHEIKAVDATGSPVQIKEVLEYLKQRIYTGLGVSAVDMGEGNTASRSTAMTLSRNLIDDTKADQRIFGAQFYFEIIQELLLESAYDPASILAEENRVYLKFKEIDLEARQAKENHLTDMALKNMITVDEARIDMGRQPFQGEGWPTGTSKKQMFAKGDGDFARTYYGLFDRDKIILQSLDEPGTEASQAEAKSRTTANATKASSSAGGNAVSNKNKPTNQHGTRSSTKLNKDALVFPNNRLGRIYYSQTPFFDYFDIVRQELVGRIRINGFEPNILKYTLSAAINEGSLRLVAFCKQAYRLGLEETDTSVTAVNTTRADTIINDHVMYYARKFEKDIFNQLEINLVKDKEFKVMDSTIASLIFDAFEYRVRLIDFAEAMRAYNYGLASGYRIANATEIYSEPTSDSACDLCKNRPLKLYQQDAIIYEELAPRHAGCSCLMRKK